MRSPFWKRKCSIRDTGSERGYSKRDGKRGQTQDIKIWRRAKQIGNRKSESGRKSKSESGRGGNPKSETLNPKEIGKEISRRGAGGLAGSSLKGKAGIEDWRLLIVEEGGLAGSSLQGSAEEREAGNAPFLFDIKMEKP